MAYGKSIELFLVNGTEDSLIIAELSNWNGKAIKIPRIEVASCNRDDITQAGVYFLFCKEAENVKEISIWKSDENNSVVSSYTMDDPEEIEEMVEKLNDVHFYFWVLLMPSGKEGYGLEIQEKDNSKEVFEVQPHTVSIGLGYFADMRFVTDIFSGSNVS